MWVVWVTAWADLPLRTDPRAAWDGVLYASGLTAILLAHEFGHYLVARRHGMDQTLPFFIPLPVALGTLGAVIELRTPARTRSGLLEMGAAGPLAGFVVAIGVLAVGLLGTQEQTTPLVVMDWPPETTATGLAAALVTVGDALRGVGLVGLGDAIGPAPDAGVVALNILANPLLFDVLGELLLGHPPGRFARLHPLALAGWAGCFLTGMNLLPIGQLDGGHILNALAPRWAARIGRVILVLVLVGGLWWPVWAIWALLLRRLGADQGLPVPEHTPVTRRAWLVAGACGVAFVACFMAVPTEIDRLALDAVRVQTPDGDRISAEEVAAWLESTP